MHHREHVSPEPLLHPPPEDSLRRAGCVNEDPAAVDDEHRVG